MPALSLFFFTYFAFIAAINPYFSLWLVHHGYSESQIGVLLAIPPAMRLLGPTSWGRLADSTGTRVKWLRLMAHASVLGLCIIGFAPYFSGYKLACMVLGLVLLHAMLCGQIPLCEALLLQQLGANTQRYGRVRLFGSIGFVVGLLALGPALDRLGIEYLLFMSGGILALHAATSWWMRDAPMRHTGKAVRLNLRQLVALPNVPLFLCTSFLMVFGHMGLYIYFSLHLANVGYSKTMIGMLWIVSTLGEIVYFWWQARAKGDPLRGYTTSYWLATARFGGMAFVAIPLGSPLWLLIALQLIHTSSFAVHHAASMVIVKRLFPASVGSTANALFNTVTYGLAGTLGALVCAGIWTHFEGRSAQAVFAFSALCCVVGGYFAWRLRQQLNRIKD